MKKIILSIIAVSMFFLVSCGDSKKTGNDADTAENHDEDTVETGDADEMQTDEDTEETDEEEPQNDGDTEKQPEEEDYSETFGLPKCSLQRKTPCYDTETGLFWSSPSDAVTHDDAVAYCYSLTDGGFMDWRLPDIDELRTLVRHCTSLEPDGKCKVSEKNDCLSYDECYDSKYCYNACLSKDDEFFSRIGDLGELWSSSKRSDSRDQFWTMMFQIPSVYYRYDSQRSYTRCTRSVNDSGEAEEVKTQTAECSELPENAEWNTVSSITQTWNGAYWEPDAESSFSDEPTSELCRFKCVDGYFWLERMINWVDRGLCMPECGNTTESVCGYPGKDMFFDKDSGLLWSSVVDDSIYIQDIRSAGENAITYCENLVESGYDDWHLPNIDELRTLIKNCPGTETGGACPVSEINGSLGYPDTNECSSCSYAGDDVGKYSKIGSSLTLCSSSPVDATSIFSDKLFWGIDFSYAKPVANGDDHTYIHLVRCVRKVE